MADEQDLNARLTSLERLVIKSLASEPVLHTNIHPAMLFILGLAALLTGYLGLGLPQHYYQPVFAALIVALVYHRQTFHMTDHPWRWPFLLLNFLVLCFLMKFMIGGGVVHPFSWLQVPGLGEAEVANEDWRSWLIPNLEFKWKDMDGITQWQLDVTRVQSLFLVFTMAAILMRFQVFASMTTLLLLVISIPTLFYYNWQWVIWFLVTTTVYFYLQSQQANQTTRE